MSKKTYNLISAVACALLLLALLVVMVGMGYDESTWSVAAIPLSLLAIATLVVIVIIGRTTSPSSDPKNSLHSESARLVKDET